MFNLYRNWILVAVMSVQNGDTSVFIIGHEGLPAEKYLLDSDYYLNHGYTILQLDRPEDQQKLIDAGLTTKNPLLINGFSSEPLKIIEAAENVKPFKFTDSNSFVQAEDGSFENQYCMCSSCYHPVPTTVTVPVSQADLDKLNAGQTLKFESGDMTYVCENCGNNQQKTYKNIKIWKTITGHTFSFEDLVAKVKKVKLGDRMYEVPEEFLHGEPERVVRMPRHFAQYEMNRVEFERAADFEERLEGEPEDFLNGIIEQEDRPDPNRDRGRRN